MNARLEARGHEGRLRGLENAGQVGSAWGYISMIEARVHAPARLADSALVAAEAAEDGGWERGGQEGGA